MRLGGLLLSLNGGCIFGGAVTCSPASGVGVILGWIEYRDRIFYLPTI